MPTSTPVRALLPVAGRALRSDRLRGGLHRLIDRFRIAPPAPAGHVSYAHVRLTWANGTVREGWLRAGEGYAFTGRAAALVVRKLLSGAGRPGAFTPAALFGSDLATEAGAQFFPTTEGVRP